MSERVETPRWIPWVAGGVIGAGIVTSAYLLGAGGALGAPAAADGEVRYAFFPFGIVFGFFWIFLLMRLFTGWWWWHGPRRYYYDRGAAWYDDPARWDEWHRRAHEHMSHGDDPRR